MGLATKKAVDNNSVAPLVCGGAIQARHIIVGRGSPRPVLQHPSNSKRNRLSQGGRGAEAPVLL